jgi:hypothetical protein
MARCGVAFQITQDILGLAGSEFFVHSTLRNRSPVRWRLQGIRTSIVTPWAEQGSPNQPASHFELNLSDLYSLDNSKDNSNSSDSSYRNGSSRTISLDTILGMDDEFHFSSRCIHVLKSGDNRSEDADTRLGGATTKAALPSLKGPGPLSRVMAADALPQSASPAFVMYTLMRQSNKEFGGLCAVCNYKMCTGGWGMTCVGICKEQRHAASIYTAFTDFLSSSFWDRFEIAVPVRLIYNRGVYVGLDALLTTSRLETQLRPTSGGPSAAIVVFPSSMDRSSDVTAADFAAVQAGARRTDAAPGSPSFAAVSVAVPQLASISVGVSVAFTFKISLFHYVNSRELVLLDDFGIFAIFVLLSVP